MSTLKIIRIGNPILRAKSRTVQKRELKTKRFQTFLTELAATCVASNGVGIAAPQVGKNKRVIVVHVNPKNPRYPDKKPFPLTLVINPKVVTKSKEVKEDWEGDLSVNLRGMVPRPVACTVEGLDKFGEKVVFDLSDDFHARVFQHEIDHLDGKMFIDKVRRKETLTELAEYKKYWKKKASKKARVS